MFLQIVRVSDAIIVAFLVILKNVYLTRICVN